MKRELELFFTALMFFTRVPCPRWVGYSEDLLNHSCKYFPLIGWIVGAAGAIVWFVAFSLFSPSVALLLSIGSTILLTGAFHEDGMADSCDGFGGGWSKEQVLLIMKDSRIGTYGTIGLCLALSVKYQSLLSLPLPLIPLSLVAGHSLSRFFAASFIYTHEYVREDIGSKAKPLAHRMSNGEFLLAAFFGIAPLLLLPPQALLSLPLLVVIQILTGRYFVKRIGGYTGDSLGAAQQIAELSFYLLMIIAAR